MTWKFITCNVILYALRENSEMPEVRVVNLTKKFGDIVALDNVNLTVCDKEYFALLGPSGCGKTTLLRLIAGLIEPDKGEIYIGGNVWTMSRLKTGKSDLFFKLLLYFHT